MKKFLSLLLAMTMVMSLIVLPARADAPSGSMSQGASLSIKKDSNDIQNLTIDVSENAVTLLATPSENAKLLDSNGTVVTNQPNPSYQWTAPNDSGVQFGTPNAANTTVSATKATESPITLTCTATWSATVGEGESAQTYTAELSDTVSLTVTDNSSALKAAIATVTYNGTNCYDSTNKTVTAYKSTSADNWSATFTQESGFTFKSATYNATNKQLQVVATKDSKDYTTYVSCTLVTVSVSASDNCDTISKDGTANLTATATAVAGTTPTYAWTYKVKDAAGEGTPLTSTTATAAFSKNDVSAQTVYTVTCTVTYGEGKTAVGRKDITVENATYEFRTMVVTPIYASRNDSPAKNIGTVLYKKGSLSETAANATYSYDVTPSSGVISVDSNGNISVITSGQATVTVRANYKGKSYTSNSVAVYASTGTADLETPTYFNSNVSYSYTDILTAANKALGYTNGYYSYYNTVVSTTLPASGLGTYASNSGINNNYGSIVFNPYSSARGKVSFTAVVKNSANAQTATVTLNIPVVPIPNISATLNAEPVTSSYNTIATNYKVTFPSDHTYYYVVGTNGSAPDYSSVSLTTKYSSTVPYTGLRATDFDSTGKCILYVVAEDNTNSAYYGKFYSGAITVTQTNHDIKYNGVVGNTVQFKHNDFTTFMNEMYGTNTTSYLTFNSVKFTSVPNATSQGTLYYSGSAMTTGYGSNYFNTNTAVANLDNVSFAVSSKVPSTTKEIRIPFTLYATRYNSYGTSAGTSVTYSGAVVISLVREDVTFTVAPGDAVTFTDSNFLNYLRAQSGINYNYNIDYVTFDQSAVDTINGGVLYSGYAGYNQVKTTDKFYYTTTNNYTQNALSDVTFRASLYAKTGTTVYIPFTIYAKYGTSSAATRQVTGTVAVKIAQTMNFVDVKPTDYFYNPVKWAVTKNITKGTSAVTFSPDKTCTRAEIVTFLWRDAGSPMPTISRNPFSDVSYSMGADFYNAILWASQMGITAGTAAAPFSPNKTCTRAEIVTFLWRYAKKPVGYGSNSFTDVNKNDHAPYYDAILWAVSKGITNGSTTTTFAPDGTCTRAQAVTFLYRYEGGK